MYVAHLQTMLTRGVRPNQLPRFQSQSVTAYRAKEWRAQVRWTYWGVYKENKHDKDSRTRARRQLRAWRDSHFKGRSSVRCKRHAASCHGVTADSASLCPDISSHHFRAAPRQDGSTQPVLFQPRRVTARLEGQTEPPVSAWCLETRLALPDRRRAVPGDASYQPGAAGPFAAVYCAPSQSLFLSLIEWHQPQTSASYSLMPCLITARQFGLSGLHLWYPWNVRPSSAAATRRCNSPS